MCSSPVNEALERAFRLWWGRNSYALEDGGSGDLLDLLEVLNAAIANSDSVALSTDNAFSKARPASIIDFT